LNKLPQITILKTAKIENISISILRSKRHASSGSILVFNMYAYLAGIIEYSENPKNNSICIKTINTWFYKLI